MCIGFPGFYTSVEKNRGADLEFEIPLVKGNVYL